uniref:IclR family transcriptional regulator n=1 Tax=Bosea sp. NBC_00436 TaxID=2969620 RepID=A0A9E8CU89_9HYPH
MKTAVQILTMFSAETPVVTVSAAASRFGLTASASSRLLASLASSGIVQRGPDRAYRPGPLAYRLGLLYHAHNRLADLINDGARKIVGETGKTCWVSVLSGLNTMLISRFPGPMEQGFYLDAGKMLPANASAAGKALMARLPDPEVIKLLNSAKLEAWTTKSKTDVATILADVEEVRQRGWGIIAGELLENVISIAVAFSAPLEMASMALSVSVYSNDLEEVARSIASLTQVAREIGDKISDPFWTDRPLLPAQAAIVAEIHRYIALSEEERTGSGAAHRTQRA